MMKSRLSRLLGHKRVLSAVLRAAEKMRLPISILDADGHDLLPPLEPGNRFPIVVADETIGWVVSPGDATTLADLLGVLATDEYEKRELAREGVQKYKELALLYDVSEKIASCLRVGEIARLIQEEVQRTIPKGRALVLLSQERGALADAVTGSEADGLLPESFRPFLSRLAGQPRPEIVNRTREDPRFAAAAADHALLVSPLVAKGNAMGTLLVFGEAPLEFRSEELRLLCALATLCASALEKARLYENIEKETQLRANFQRYLSPTIVEDIIAHRTQIGLVGKSMECSILFSDICGFTPMTEHAAPETIVQLLNEYFTVMSEIVFRHGGTLDKFIGDAIMAVFGAPFPAADAHLSAVRVALEMHQAMFTLRSKWRREGNPGVRHRIGINTGSVIAGNIGSSKRMDYTVIGDAVNLAARMETLSPAMESLFSHHTFAKVKDHVIAAPIPLMHVKGKKAPVWPYRILAVENKPGSCPHWSAAVPVDVTDEEDDTSREGLFSGVTPEHLVILMHQPLRAGARVHVSAAGAATSGINAWMVEQEDLVDPLGTAYARGTFALEPTGPGMGQGAGDLLHYVLRNCSADTELRHA